MKRQAEPLSERLERYLTLEAQVNDIERKLERAVENARRFSSQKPERRAIERDESAVLAWKRKTWPALKKSVPPSGG